MLVWPDESLISVAILFLLFLALDSWKDKFTPASFALSGHKEQQKKTPHFSFTFFERSHVPVSPWARVDRADSAEAAHVTKKVLHHPPPRG